MRALLTRTRAVLRSYAVANPVKVRAAVAAVLVFVGQYVPAVKDMAGSDAFVDAVTGALIALLAADAARVVTKRNK
ncbi:hypothetical protein AB0P37_08550 [Streptomyces antimycoticus]|uniref:hypothetical protein n=1 Tax=Streptomyces antimycoticus TaxID=68175 RepID=UPI00342B8B9A